MVVTNFAGFYRYRLGDVVKVVSYYNKTPVIEFMYRKGQLLNLAGEKTSESAVKQAIKETLKTWDLDLEDYTVKQDLERPIGRYQFYIEVNNLNSLTSGSGEIRDELENSLAEANPRYRVGLENKRIAPLTVYFVKQGTFQTIRTELVKRGASLNQVKMPRLVRNQALIDILDQNMLIQES